MNYISDALPLPPVVSSAPLAWQGIRLEQIHLEAGGLPAHYQAHHLLMLYQVEGPYVVQFRHGGRTSESVYHTGDLGLFPAGDCNVDLTWRTPSDNVYLTIEDQQLARLVGVDRYHSQMRLAENLQFTDPLLSQLGRQLLAAVGRPHALGQLYVESLTGALCYQLLEHYATHGRRYREVPQLGRSVLARLDAYLEAQVEQPISLEDLAGLANLSVYHFARLFKQTTGVSPYQYVLRWKVERARLLLRADRSSVADLSEALGFASPVSFAAAFRRVVGCTPQQYQRRL